MVIFAGVVILFALAAGALYARGILGPLRALSTATEALAGGDPGARFQGGPAGEIGYLGARFNSMAEQIEAQAAALREARDELELRVEQRTAKLARANAALEVEI